MVKPVAEIEKITVSLVKEYLYKKNFKSTLDSLHSTNAVGFTNYRVELVKELGIELLLKENKLKALKPLDSILEVLVKAFLNSQRKSETTPRNTTSNKSTQTSNHGKHKLHNFRSNLRTISTQTEEYHKTNQQSVKNYQDDDSYSSEFFDPGTPADFEEMQSAQVTASKPSVSSRHLSRTPSNRSSVHENEDEYDAINSIIPLPTSFDNEFVLKQQHRPNSSRSPSVEGTSLAESILKSKQNVLVQGWPNLSNSEKFEKKAKSLSLAESEKDPLRVDNQSASLELCDIEDEELDFNRSKVRVFPNFIHLRNISTRCKTNVKQLDLQTWRLLKSVVLGGTTGYLSEGWIGQGFIFNQEIPFGLIQNKGGPCGVLCVVQTLLLRNLFFGSEFSSELPLSPEAISALFKSPPIINNSKLMNGRTGALKAAIVEILWRCSTSQAVRICLQGNEPGAELVEIPTLEDLNLFVDRNLHRFDCIGLVYSAVLSRGIECVLSEMDFQDGPLIGQHGYCTVELINLLLSGKSISNMHNDDVCVDGKVLRGMDHQSDIGFLSLYEYYGSYEVGSFMKTPKYPIWIICSESHFSVLFSHSMSTLLENKVEFELFYYDGLANQKEIVRLTICTAPGSSQYCKNSETLKIRKNYAMNASDDDHLIPPLEKCIRTKWIDARISWNETEPLL